MGTVYEFHLHLNGKIMFLQSVICLHVHKVLQLRRPALTYCKFMKPVRLKWHGLLSKLSACIMTAMTVYFLGKGCSYKELSIEVHPHLCHSPHLAPNDYNLESGTHWMCSVWRKIGCMTNQKNVLVLLLAYPSYIHRAMVGVCVLFQ
jgi:hypothetical protein